MVHRPEANSRGVGHDSAVPDRHEGCERLHCVPKLVGPLVTVDLLTKRAAGLQIVFLQWSHPQPSNRCTTRLSCHDRHALLYVEAKRLVEGQRAHVERVLEQPNSGSTLPPFEHGLHQFAPDPRVLPFEGDCNRSDPSNGAALVEEVGADDASVNFRDYPPDCGMGDEYVQQTRRGLKRREVTLKPVVVMEGAKGVEDDLCAVGCISGLSGPQRHLSDGWRSVHHRHWMEKGSSWRSYPQ